MAPSDERPRASAAGATKSLARTSLGLLPAQLILRAGEAALPLLLAAWFGDSRTTDAFMLLWAIFGLAGALVFSVFQDSAMAPVLIGLRAARPAVVPRFVGAILGHTLLGGAVVAVVVGAVAALVVRATSGQLWLALVVPFAAQLLATALRTLHASVLNAFEHYRAPPMAAALSSALAIGLCAVLRGPVGIAAVPIGLLVGEAVAAALLMRATAAALGARPPLSLERVPETREVGRLLAAELAGNVISRANPVVDQLVATAAGVAGGGTLLRYTGDLALMPTSLLQAALLSVLLSRLAMMATAGDLPGVARTVRRTLLIVVPLLVAFAGALALVREPLFALAYGHGAMSREATAQMAAIAPAFLVGLPAFGALLVLARAHVALKNSRILPRMGLFSALCNLLLDLMLVGPLDLTGIALATSITSWAVAAAFGIALVRRCRRDDRVTRSPRSEMPAGAREMPTEVSTDGG